MLNGAETHGERKEERAEANAVAVGLVPFPRGALRMKQTRREEGWKDGRRGREGMQIKARLVDPPVDAHPADNLVKDKRRESKNVARERFPKLVCRIFVSIIQRTLYTRNNIKRWDQQKSDGVWIFLDPVTFDDGVTPL